MTLCDVTLACIDVYSHISHFEMLQEIYYFTPIKISSQLFTNYCRKSPPCLIPTSTTDCHNELVTRFCHTLSVTCDYRSTYLKTYSAFSRDFSQTNKKFQRSINSPTPRTQVLSPPRHLASMVILDIHSTRSRILCIPNNNILGNMDIQCCRNSED